MQSRFVRKCSPSPTLPRKRGRESTEIAARLVDQPLMPCDATDSRYTRAKPRGNECSRSTPEFVISKSSPVCTPALPSRVTTLG
jgi:hypothetical protein